MDNASKALCVGTLLMLDCMCLCCLRLRSLRGKLESSPKNRCPCMPRRKDHFDECTTKEDVEKRSKDCDRGCASAASYSFLHGYLLADSNDSQMQLSWSRTR